MLSIRWRQYMTQWLVSLWLQDSCAERWGDLVASEILTWLTVRKTSIMVNTWLKDHVNMVLPNHVPGLYQHGENYNRS